MQQSNLEPKPHTESPWTTSPQTPNCDRTYPQERDRPTPSHPSTHLPATSALWSTFLHPTLLDASDNLRCSDSGNSRVNLTVGYFSQAEL
ncbi:MAG: hypothetical protein ABI262_09595 [Microcoleus sp.]